MAENRIRGKAARRSDPAATTATPRRGKTSAYTSSSGALAQVKKDAAGRAMPAGALEWLASGERGISSETMFTHLTGIDALSGHEPDHPYDPDDLDRCLKLLAAVPSLRADLHLMARVSKEWAALVARWDQIERSHLGEVGLGWTKANSAPRTYALMNQVLAGATT